jgi:uncharacterized protein with HEPN domain
MSRERQMFLDDIRDSCRKIIKYTQGLSRQEFFSNTLVYDATLRNIEIIGEAAKHIPDSIRSQFSHIEWRKIVGLRDVVIHAYFGLDDNIIWDVVKNKIPELLTQIEDMGNINESVTG